MWMDPPSIHPPIYPRPKDKTQTPHHPHTYMHTYIDINDDTKIFRKTGYLNLAMIILGVHFSHACVDVLSAIWSFGLKVV